jgi:membrane fusion protein, macrolide-specific efflux system
MNQTSSRRSVRPWYVILLAAVAAGVIIFGVTQLGTSTASTARTSKENVAAEDGVIQTTVSGSGEVEPGVDDTLNFGTSGTLQSVNVKVGDHVKKGQLIATLDPSSAELTLQEAENDVTEAEDNLTEVEDGDSTGSSSDSSSGGSSDSSSSSTKTSDSSSEPTAEDTAYKPGSTNAGSTNSGSAGAGKTSGSTNSGSNGQGTTTTAARTVTQIVTVTATTPKVTPTASELEQAKLEVEEDEATVTADEKTVDEMKLYAPAAGMVASLSSDSVGATVSSASGSSGSTSSGSGSSSTGSSTAADDASSGSSSTSSGFAELINDNQMTMSVSLSEDDISSVKVGQIATVSITALSGVELAGHVTSISPLGSDSSGVVSYDATLTITQTNPKVLPGMSATATIVTGQAQGVTVPSDAITGSGSNATVELVKGSKVTTQPVVVGLKGSSRSQIVSGLKSGQEVQVTITLPSLGTSSSNSSTTSSSTSPFGAGGFGGGAGGATGGRGSFRAFFGGGGAG